MPGDRHTRVDLRLSRACGHVGRCDDCKSMRTAKQFRSSGRPIIAALEPGETRSRRCV
jgi:hypothetical protein